MEKNTKLTELIKESLSKLKKPSGKEKLRESIKSLVREVIKEDKVKEGLFTSGWSKIKANLDKAIDFKAKKAELEKAINSANTATKGAWLNKLKAANDEMSVEAIIADLDKRPGKDLEDKLSVKNTVGAATGALFKEGKKVVKIVKK
jgi:hypothetical protein